MRERIEILLLIYGLLLVAVGSAALKPPRPKFKIATTSTTTTTEEPEPEVTTVQTDVNATTGHTLTGIPQIDYIWDPNLPRELNGFNLSSYPFYSTVPTEEINFKCDGLHDGFYASIEHKCQVYHHCLYGTRYDFLCANFTAFDQKTFICHFASEVDCANSKKYWHRNDALYQATTTTTTSTTTTSTAAPPPAPVAPVLPAARPSLRDREINRRRRPLRRRPAYDYYDDEYYDEEYDRTRPRGYDRRDSYEYDDRNFRNDRDRDRERDRDRDYREPERDRTVRHRERDSPSGYGAARDANDQRPLYEDRDQREREKLPPIRPNRRRPVGDQFDEDSRPLARDRTRDPETASYPDVKDSDDTRARDPPRDTDDRRYSDKRYRTDYDDKEPAPVPAAAGNSGGLVKPAAPSTSVYARPRAPPKIRRPVPVSEKNKYAYNASASAAVAIPTDEPRRRPDPVDDDYLHDDADARPRRPGRRRPAYREKETNYEARETTRDRERDRDRNYRTRYQDEDDGEVLHRKRPDRQRDRQYERGDRLHTYDRDRPAIERTATNTPITERPAVQYPSRSAERPSASVNTRPSSRDEGFNRAKFPVREREPAAILQSEPIKKPNYYRPRMEKTIADSPVKQEDEDDGDGYLDVEEEPEITETRGKTEQRFPEPEVIPEEPSPRPLSSSRGSQRYEKSEPETGPQKSAIDYTAGSSSEYYDEPEELPASSPRTTLRVVKRPFLPSRGGNPNPRGLKQVGLRVEPRPEEEKSNGRISARVNSGEEISEGLEDRKYNGRRQPYDAYRTVQSDVRLPKEEAADEEVEARPQSRRLQKEDSPSDLQEDAERFSNREESPSDTNYNRPSIQSPKVMTTDAESPQGLQNAENSDRQRPNDAVHRLQDIPESEYDVTLNDALTPPLTQESNLPSGFILPLHRQLERDTNLQSSQRNYLFTRPTESVAQLKLSSTSGSNSFHVPPLVERSRTTFPRQGTVFAPGHQEAPWQGYVEY